VILAADGSWINKLTLKLTLYYQRAVPLKQCIVAFFFSHFANNTLEFTGVVLTPIPADGLVRGPAAAFAFW
jgi:hypothetical protein